MRPKVRIDIFLSKLNEEFLHKLFIKWFDTNFEAVELAILRDIEKIRDYWKGNSDLRFAQVILNMGYIPNIPGVWYYNEDIDVLIDLGCEPRDVMLWGKNYDKDMNRLPETKWILIKDLETDHIKSIFKYFKEMGRELNPTYKKVLKDELKTRENV